MPTANEKYTCRSFCKVSLCCWTGLALFVALCAGITFWFASHHIVQTNKGLVVVPKLFVRLTGTYVDIRPWKWEDAVARHDVSEALVKANHGDLLPQPPPEPSHVQQAAATARHIGQEAKRIGTNVWQRVRTRASELQKDIKRDLNDIQSRCPV